MPKNPNGSIRGDALPNPYALPSDRQEVLVQCPTHAVARPCSIYGPVSGYRAGLERPPDDSEMSFAPLTRPAEPTTLRYFLALVESVQCWKMKHTHTEVNLNAVQNVLTAARFAAEKHAQQKRKGIAAEPYINHLLEVAQLVSSALTEPDTDQVIAALLHDTIEDAGVTVEELTVRFGPDVAHLVSELTDDKSLPKKERKRLQVENAPKKSVRAQTIKLADKISNLRSILSSPPADWSEQRKTAYFDWAKQVVDGISSPNPVLKKEFEKTFNQRIQQTSGRITHPNGMVVSVQDGITFRDMTNVGPRGIILMGQQRPTKKK
jgi:hypothetical protein